MARPAGEVRRAVIAAIQAGPCTLVDIVQRSCVGYDAARYTVQHALRSGELEICGHERRPHAKRWLAIYDLREQPDEQPTALSSGCTRLNDALSAWRNPAAVE